MSTLTSKSGPVTQLATLVEFVEEGSEVHDHTHAHTSSADIPGSLRVRNLQVTAVGGSFDNTMPSGLVSEDVTITEALDVVDDAFIRVQPNPDVDQSAVFIGFDQSTMTAKDTGVFVHRGKDVITINHQQGIRAPVHTIEAANIQSEYNVATNHDVNAGSIIKTPQLRTTRIKLYADGHTHLKIEAPIVLENGGINVSNVDSTTLTALSLNMKKATLLAETFTRQARA